MSQKSQRVCVTIMLLKFASPFVKSQGSVIVVGQVGYASVKNREVLHLLKLREVLRLSELGEALGFFLSKIRKVLSFF